MTERPEIYSLLGEALLGAIRQALREEMQAAQPNSSSQGDRLLDAKEAAALLAVSPDWLYRRADRLPFTRKLAPRVVRFSYQAIQKYLAARK